MHMAIVRVTTVIILRLQQLEDNNPSTEALSRFTKHAVLYAMTAFIAKCVQHQQCKM